MKRTIVFSTPGARKLILSGRKWQTLRLAERRGDVEPGDELVLKEWIGRPRQRGSRVRLIASVTCTQVSSPYLFRLDAMGCPVYVRENEAWALITVPPQTIAALALADGYEDWGDLVEVLRGFYGRKATELVAIKWKPLTENRRDSHG